jgi:uncharacterized Zn ribbon protein
VLDIKDAYKKLKEGARVTEIRLRNISQKIRNQQTGNTVAKIDAKIFNETLDTLKKLRQ